MSDQQLVPTIQLPGKCRNQALIGVMVVTFQEAEHFWQCAGALILHSRQGACFMQH